LREFAGVPVKKSRDSQDLQRAFMRGKTLESTVEKRVKELNYTAWHRKFSLTCRAARH
jgi:hypothetical protein